MAKKNLSALMQSIMGERPETAQQDGGNPNPAGTKADSIQKSAVTSADGATLPKRSKGRPRQDNNETVATFKIDRDVLMKLKYISLMEERMQKEILHAALSRYIDEWESIHGVVTLPSRPS